MGLRARFQFPVGRIFHRAVGRPKWTGRTNGANIARSCVARRLWELDDDASWSGCGRVTADLTLPPRRLVVCGLLSGQSAGVFCNRGAGDEEGAETEARQRQGACRRSRRAAPHRRASSHRAAALRHRHGSEMGQPAQCSIAAAWPARMDAGAVPRGDGPQRRGDCDHLAVRSGRVDGRRRQEPQRGALLQRLCRPAGARLSRPVRRVRLAGAARYRRQPARDRIRLRRARCGRHRVDDQLRRQMAGRSPPSRRYSTSSTGARRSSISIRQRRRAAKV